MAFILPDLNPSILPPHQLSLFIIVLTTHTQKKKKKREEEGQLMSLQVQH
jgi:hypothetical protein